jgi:pimeloyl-ACP methyl ester carboxylesterase
MVGPMAQFQVDHDLSGFALAYGQDGGTDEIGRCGFMFLGGFKSDMTGKKAESLAELGRSTRRVALRFDYSGHGKSSGKFVDGTISDWLEQTTHMFLRHTTSKRIIVGSSMGGWLALLLARKLKYEDPTAFRRIAGMVLLAPATDMTQDLMWDKFDDAAKEQLRDHGIYYEPSHYGAPYEITAKLLADGVQHQILAEGLSLPFPIRILQGADDNEVPVSHAIKTFDALTGPDITITMIKGGDHRLSTPTQLKLVCDTVLNLAERADGVNY